MAEKRSETEKKEGKDELGKPFKPVKKQKTAEVLAAMEKKFTEVIQTVNANTEIANKRFETVEANQTEITKILSSMRQGPGLSSVRGADGSMTEKEKMTYGLLDLVLKDGEKTPMDQAFKMAETFNKIYLTGQTNMLKMMALMTKKGKLSDLFGEETKSE